MVVAFSPRRVVRSWLSLSDNWRLLTVAVACAPVAVPLELLVRIPVCRACVTPVTPVVREALCDTDATLFETLYDGGADPDVGASGPTLTVADTTPAAETFSFAPNAYAELEACWASAVVLVRPRQILASKFTYRGMCPLLLRGQLKDRTGRT